MSAVYYNSDKSDPLFLTQNAKQLKKKTKATLRKTRAWLDQQNVFTLHKPAIRAFKRNHYIVTNIDDVWETDIIDLKAYKLNNNQFSYLLTIIDIFTKYAWVVPLKTKSATDVLKAFRGVLQSSKRKPRILRSDRGKEFKNRFFKPFLDANGIQQQFPQTTSLFKCAVVEVFNKTLKSKMFRYFTYRSGSGKKSVYRRYIDVLQDIVTAYNHTVHGTTKMRPADIEPHHVPMVYRNTHRKHRNIRYQFPKFTINDFVRVVKKKTLLNSGIGEQWNPEIFIVDNVIEKNPYPLYKLRDLQARKINGKFYAQELQKLTIPADTPIEILKVKGLDKNRELYARLQNGSTRWVPITRYLNRDDIVPYIVQGLLTKNTKDKNKK